MKLMTFALSLFILCSCTTTLTDSQKLSKLPFQKVAHYDKYTLQIIVVSSSKTFISCEDLLTDSDNELSHFPLLQLKPGESGVADETTPLLVANAIGESADGPIIRDENLEVVGLGKKVSGTFEKIPNSENIRVHYSFSDKKYEGIETSKYDAKTTIGMPLFSEISMEGQLAQPCGEWKLLGSRSNDGEESLYVLARVVAPDRSKLKSIVPQQIIRH